MRVIFVGLHNKPGLKPLDSSTKTGQIVDRIEALLQIRIERTNLFNIDRLPDKKEMPQLIRQWHHRHLPAYNDIVVLLGKIVGEKFTSELNPDTNKIKVNHPASIFGHEKINEYVLSIATKIKMEVQYD